MITLEKYDLKYEDDFVDFIKEFQKYGDEFEMMGFLNTALEYMNIDKKYNELSELELKNIFPQYLDFIKKCEDFKTLPKKDWVEADIYVICNNGKLIGEMIFRRRLNKGLLLNSWGHISYKIKHSERGSGYGSVALKLMLNNVWQLGYGEVMISCKENNIPSARIIEKNGGILNRLNKIDDSKPAEKEYWVFNPLYTERK